VDLTSSQCLDFSARSFLTKSLFLFRFPCIFSLFLLPRWQSFFCFFSPAAASSPSLYQIRLFRAGSFFFSSAQPVLIVWKVARNFAVPRNQFFFPLGACFEPTFLDVVLLPWAVPVIPSSFGSCKLWRRDLPAFFNHGVSRSFSAFFLCGVIVVFHPLLPPKSPRPVHWDC